MRDDLKRDDLKQGNLAGDELQLGAYGWSHARWNEDFYPADLPADWQLSYYSNEFNTVLVPCSYWQTTQVLECDEWLDSVHKKFWFYVECSAQLTTDERLAEFKAGLLLLQPQLAGLVLFDENLLRQHDTQQKILDLAEELNVAVYSRKDPSQAHSITCYQMIPPASSSIVFLEHDLLDLRQARKVMEGAFSGVENLYPEQTSIIVHHPTLSANDLIKFRSVLEIMGF